MGVVLCRNESRTFLWQILKSDRVFNRDVHVKGSPISVSGQWYRALLLPLRRGGVSPRGIRATGTQPDAGGFVPRGEPFRRRQFICIVPNRFERGQVAPVKSRFAFRERESQGLRV